MSKPKPSPQRLADLKPQEVVDCLACNTLKPMAGAVKFREHWVCATCTARLKKAPNP